MMLRKHITIIILNIFVTIFTHTRASTFEEHWHHMQRNYKELINALSSTSTKLDLYHTEWKTHTEKIRDLILGPTKKDIFLSNPISGTMLRGGFSEGQKFEVAFIKNQISPS